MSYTRIFSEIKQQLHKHRPTLVVICTATFLVLGAITALQIWRDIPINHLTRDVAAVARVPPWTGALSSLGMVLWSAAAALCFFSAAMTRRTGSFNSLRLFFYYAGGSTTFLLLDDLFEIHENIPELLGMNEELFHGVHIVLILLFIVLFRHQILQTDYVLFVLALGSFGLSLIVDVLPQGEDLRSVYDGLDYLLEDGSKFIGICFWLGYFAHTSAWAIQSDTEQIPVARE